MEPVQTNVRRGVQTLQETLLQTRLQRVQVSRAVAGGAGGGGGGRSFCGRLRVTCTERKRFLSHRIVSRRPKHI